MADINYKSFANITFLGDVLIDEDLHPKYEDFSDTLKFSNVRNGVVVTRDIHGCKEDCIDINNGCQNLTVTTGICYPHGKYLATVKGESCKIKLQLITKYKKSVVEYGNWSDQGNGICRDNTLEVISPVLGAVVVVRCGYAEWPRMIGNVKFKKDYVGSFAIKTYCFFKSIFCKSQKPLA